MPLADVIRPRVQSMAGELLSRRTLLYTCISTLAVSLVIANALQNYSNFYSVAVHLSKSGRSVLVLANFSLLIALACGQLVQYVFFGSLRAVEVERLYDRMWFFVTESLLAFTIFRDEFDIPFGIMFGFLLFVKSFHWLMADRVEWMNQMPYPGPPTLFHIRINALFFVLWTTNLVMITFAVENVMTNGVGAIVLFASEYAILLASSLNSMAKYLLSAYEFKRATARGGENAPPWENKSMLIFYVDLATDLLKLITYVGFFAIIITFYGVPLNVVRDVYVTARSFITRLRDLMRYRSATRNMDERYPNATEQEMGGMSDRTCIICREEMVAQGLNAPTQSAAQDGPNMTPKKLPCGHIFHFHCLRSWLERQQSCPTCRRGVLDTTPPQQAGRRLGDGPMRGPAPVANNPFAAPPGQPQPARFGNMIRALLGAPQQPPQPPPGVGLPPQFAFGQQPPPPPPPNLNWAQLPQGIFYPHPQLQAPPFFQGFYGPGGVWQHWPVDRRWGALQPGQGQQANRVIPGTTTPQGRDGSSTSNVPNSQTSSAGPSSRSQTSLGNAGETSPAPETGSSTAASSVTRRDVPPLIPIYEFNIARSSSRFPQQQQPQIPLPNAGGSVPSPPQHAPLQTHQPWIPPQPSTPHSPPPAPPLQSSWSEPRVTTRTTTSQNRAPLSSLPPPISDDQLVLLDRLSREAIDERLRVLEGVSGAITRSIEELTRLRSVLPPSLQPTSTQVTSLQPSTTPRAAPQSSESSLPGTPLSSISTESPSISGPSSLPTSPERRERSPSDSDL
ncbi:hypothetical protein OF83DRAFT_1052428 [Amylostereum chailletii]|nr:hypothetical protein OF83DRAFT_1052428 [Amylostereum chailletii]